MDWFHTLNKPFLTPPDAVFMPAWIVLYILIAISFVIFIRKNSGHSKKLPLVFFFIQLILNFAWPFVFFGMQNIGAALAVIILMWIFIVLTIITFMRHSKIAAMLLLPYLLWVSFAFYLNLGYYVLN